RKHIPAELNYEIHYKELLGIVWALKHWRAFLLSLSSPFEVLTDYSSLKYFMSSKVLTWCQARWAEFHFSITYCPGRLATLPDALSRWDNIYPDEGEDFISKNPMNFQQLIKQDEVQPSRFCPVKVDFFPNFIESIQKKLRQDSQYSISPSRISWTPWPREDSQTCQSGFPLVQNDSIYQGLCLILSTLFKNPEYPPQEVCTPQTSSNIKWSLDLSFNGLYHSTSNVQFL
ncbi:hypothetical protein O181_116047, partial [Austropuccinia psidii MF-1]|nr:hypothetical protein [Austropuccinia psidii MF-1]